MKESPSRSAHLDIGVLFLYRVPSDITTVVSVSFDSTYSETEADLKEKRKMGMTFTFGHPHLQYIPYKTLVLEFC